MDPRSVLGRGGEDLAAAYLTAAGFVVLDRNWRCRDGELDIVGRDGDVLVFCEVKTRSGRGFGAPVEAVTREKALRLRRLACRWLLDRRPEYAGTLRFDVVSVYHPPDGPPVVEHLREAF